MKPPREHWFCARGTLTQCQALHCNQQHKITFILEKVIGHENAILKCKRCTRYSWWAGCSPSSFDTLPGGLPVSSGTWPHHPEGLTAKPLTNFSDQMFLQHALFEILSRNLTRIFHPTMVLCELVKTQEASPSCHEKCLKSIYKVLRNNRQAIILYYSGFSFLIVHNLYT